MTTRAQLERLLDEVQQSHLLRFADRLEPERLDGLLAQIAELDFEWLQRAWTTQPAIPEPAQLRPYPHIVRDDDADRGAAMALGTQALRDGRAATLLVAGGQGSRLGFEGPKGNYPIGAVSGHTLFRIHAERLVALGRRHGVVPPLYCMTSAENHDETVRAFAEAGNFGLPADRVLIFQQGRAPAFDEEGKLLLAAEDALVLAPNGNGGLFAAMRHGGAFDHMKRHGVDVISYIHVDNPLAQSCDARFVGYHLLRESQYSCKALYKVEPGEKIGSFVLVDGRPRIVEYTLIPPALANQKNAAGELAFGWGSPGFFMWSRAFAEAQADRKDLPVHKAHKKLAHVNARGERLTPREPNGYKLEMFAMDTLPDAERVVILACDRDAEFAPVKNAEGVDSVASARAMMTALARRWLVAAGAKVVGEPAIEISPLFALDGDDLDKAACAGLVIERDHYLGHEARSERT
jgi:UDP-N-acetylglucosamine/UDP-N-acetylgalactosamine diphosphorylase